MGSIFGGGPDIAQPKLPTREELAEAARKENRRAARAGGTQNTILGGSNKQGRIGRKTLLGS